MSGPFNHYVVMPTSDRSGQSLGSYASPHRESYSRIAGPSIHSEGIAFWYRPEQPASAENGGHPLYHRNTKVSATVMESKGAIKHKRTRSGCFTCRARRVKCDETRPACERCRKGNRDCKFPPASSSSLKRTSAAENRSRKALLSQRVKNESSQSLNTIRDESTEEEEESASPKTPSRAGTSRSQGRAHHSSPTKSASHYTDGLSAEPKEESSPSNADASSVSEAEQTVLPPRMKPPTASRWSHLNRKMQAYLQFHQDHLTHYHYFFKLDPTDFIHNEFIDLALTFEPLLYAVVAFSAYHHTLRRSDGKLRHFWKYYCNSIILLRKWLEKHNERNETVILTILQLASFEEYLGDLANLASHHRAAHSILTSLYSYDNFMETETSQRIFDWFVRTDIMHSLMSGTSTILDRRWFTASLDFHRKQIETIEIYVEQAITYFAASCRLINFDMANVFANAMTLPNVMEDLESISQRLHDLRLQIQAIHETASAMTDSNFEADDDESSNASSEAFDPRIPLFRNALWPLNSIWIDWYSTMQMLKHQSAMINLSRQQANPESPGAGSLHNPADVISVELQELAMVQCQIYEAIERSPEAPEGAVLGAHGNLGLSCVFLNKEPKYTMWARRKLANIENMGYVWPPGFRRRMAQIWNDEEIVDWWLPGGEGRARILIEIRAIGEERLRENRLRGIDDGHGDLREIKAIFERMNLGLLDKKMSMSSSTGTEVESFSGLASSASESDSGGEGVVVPEPSSSKAADDSNKQQRRKSGAKKGKQKR